MDKLDQRRLIKLIPIVTTNEPSSPNKSYLDFIDFETKSSLHEDDSPTVFTAPIKEIKTSRSNSIRPHNSTRSNATSPIKPVMCNQTAFFPTQNLSFTEINQRHNDCHDPKPFLHDLAHIRRKLVFPSLHKNEQNSGISPKRNSSAYCKRSSTITITDTESPRSAGIDMLSENIINLVKEHENLRNKLINQEIIIKKLQERQVEHAKYNVPRFGPSTPVTSEQNLSVNSPFQVTFRPEERWSEPKQSRRRFPREIFCQTKKTRLSF